MGENQAMDRHIQELDLLTLLKAAYVFDWGENTRALQLTSTSFLAYQNFHPTFGQLLQEPFFFHRALKPTSTSLVWYFGRLDFFQ